MLMMGNNDHNSIHNNNNNNNNPNNNPNNIHPNNQYSNSNNNTHNSNNKLFLNPMSHQDLHKVVKVSLDTRMEITIRVTL